MIEEAEEMLAAASRAGRPGRFQYEAAIQSAHAQRAVTGRSDWEAIALLYEGLIACAPTIGARVGHAAALAEARGTEAAIAALDAIPVEEVKAYQPYWALRAHLLKSLGRAAEARQAYERFLAYFPESRLAPTVGFRLGLLRFEAKEFLPAAAAFERALADSLAPELHSAARYDLALCHRQLGDQDKARAELERYRAESPSGAQAADATFQLADLDEGGGHLEDAARGFGRTLALSPAPSLALEAAFRLGRCREQLHDGPGALKAYQVATQSAERAHPMRLSALARVAALHEARGETTLAVAAYRDIMRNAKDQELVAAAADRVSALAGSQRRR